MNDDFAATIKVSRSPEEVRAALTTLAGLDAWWAPVTGNGEAGGELAFTFHTPESTVMRVDEASTELVHWTCVSAGNAPEWLGTEVTFTIAPVGNGSAIFFRHHGLTTALECFEDCYSGWTHFMLSLKQYLDTGVGMPFRSAEDNARRAS